GGIRQGNHLPVVAELVHLAKALVEIEQLLHPAQALADVLQLRRDPRHLAEERIGEDVAIQINDCCTRRGRHAEASRLELWTFERSIAASAADLKFLHHLQQSLFRNFKSKAAPLPKFVLEYAASGSRTSEAG